jgi:hypothetical protein
VGQQCLWMGSYAVDQRGFPTLSQDDEARFTHSGRACSLTGRFDRSVVSIALQSFHRVCIRWMLLEEEMKSPLDL